MELLALLALPTAYWHALRLFIIPGSELSEILLLLLCACSRPGTYMDTGMVIDQLNFCTLCPVSGQLAGCLLACLPARLPACRWLTLASSLCCASSWNHHPAA